MADFVPASQASPVSTDAGDAIAEVLRPPTTPVGRGFLVMLTLANMSWLLVGIPVLQLLVPDQVNALDPLHKVAMLGVISTLGGLAGIVSTLLSGALSDRTTSRLGRRRPWILGGALAVAVALVLLSSANSILLVAIGWSLMNFSGNVMYSVLNVIIPDRVPVQQRGIASAVAGLATSLSALLGLILVTFVLSASKQSFSVTYYTLLPIGLVLVGGFTLFYREPRLPREARPPFRLGAFLANFWVSPRRFPDFGFAWVTRFLVLLGYFVGIGYSNYYLRDVIHYARLFPGQSVDAGVTLLSAIALITSLFSVLLAGFASDRLGSRKPFVIMSSILLGLSLLILAFVHSWPATIVAFVLIGVAFGAYSAVDSALVTQVLPRAEDRGKDMGVIGIALSLAQFIAPSLGALAISLFASNVDVGYTSLYLLAAVLTFLGALLVLPIKGVR